LKHLVFQTIGGSFSISAAQSGFVNKMITTLASIAPDVDPFKVIATGATQIRTAFPEDQVDSIVIGYMAGLKVAFAIMTGTCGMAFLLSMGVSWKRIHGDAAKKVEAIA
jgi:MFS transporter, DHA2 family, glioxin efflux transporter